MFLLFMVRSVFLKNVDNYFRKKDDTLETVLSGVATYGIYKIVKGIYKTDLNEFSIGIVLSYFSKLYK